VEYLGRGTFGLVFKAFDRLEKRYIALKMAPPCRSMSLESEYKTLRDLNDEASPTNHNIVKVIRFFYMNIHYVTRFRGTQRLR
jgi:serine/threonine protein kinase